MFCIRFSDYIVVIYDRILCKSVVVCNEHNMCCCSFQFVFQMAQSNDETAIEGLLNLQHNDKNKHASASNQETGKETNDTTQHIVSMTPGDTSSTKNLPALQEK